MLNTGQIKNIKPKMPVAIIGSGNIGSDLLSKIQKSKILTCALFIGQNPDSAGIKRAQNLGVVTATDSINAIINHPNLVQIVFDATSAKAHLYHAPILKKLKKFTIDMTPSRVGQMCIPILNLNDCLTQPNVNMVTCGGQANTPLIKAIMNVHPETQYVEIVSSISSKSAGMGTRDNIDEYTQTTSDGVKMLSGVPKCKTIIILNPAIPPILMHNTIYAKIEKPDITKLTAEIQKMVTKIQSYVPGFKLIVGPIHENCRVTLMTEVAGAGDFLPTYAGNLDIINSAAIRVAEGFARHMLQ
jgi:acetaldehyde dehydrogenase (acetylating)